MHINLTTSTGAHFRHNWQKWQPTETAVLSVIRDQPAQQILLILKKRGLGKGKFNMPGGRIDPGETPLQAVIRETREEVGLTPLNPQLCGKLNFVFTTGYSLHCQVFCAFNHTGTLHESDEAAPFWCHENELPYGNMWSDDRIWMPLMLKQRYFEADFIFEEDLMLWYTLRFADPNA